MNKFTLKDLIKYNSPCKSCGNTPRLYLKHAQLDGGTDFTVSTPQISDEHFLHFGLTIKYSKSLALQMNPSTHKFRTVSRSSELSSAHDDFIKFISERFIMFEIQCRGKGSCGTTITTSDLEFDFDRSIFKPIVLDFETILVNSNDFECSISNNYGAQTTFINTKPAGQFQYDTMNFDHLAAPLYEFKNKSDIIDRVKMYLTFS